jgi:hypothetical protein
VRRFFENFQNLCREFRQFARIFLGQFVKIRVIRGKKETSKIVTPTLIFFFA